MNTLSKREKVLLYILALVIIFSSSFYFLISPSMQKLDDAKIQLEETKLTKLDMYAKLQGAQDIQDNISKANEGINSITVNYYQLMENDEMERLITGILTEHNMTPDSLVIAKDPVIKQSENSVIEIVYITKSYVSVNAQGTLANLLEIIDDIDNRDSIRISSFATDGSYGNMDAVISISIDFEVFMYENPQK